MFAIVRHETDALCLLDILSEQPAPCILEEWDGWVSLWPVPSADPQEAARSIANWSDGPVRWRGALLTPL